MQRHHHGIYFRFTLTTPCTLSFQVKMRLSLEHDRVVRLIKESISLMCKTSLNYDIELNVEGLLGITLDKKDIFLVNINESFCNETAEDFLAESAEEGSPRGQKRSVSSDDQGELTEFKEEHSNLPSSTARKRRGRNFRRHHKKNSAGVWQVYNYTL